ncbi:MAG: 4-hydroxybenzoate polyprenyltransferase related protein, partial [Candidatus Nanosalina sp. J07AB43]
FAAFFIVYNLDRYLGKSEDEENMPMRTRFVKRYGKSFLALSIGVFTVALFMAFNQGSLTFLLTIIPIVMSLLYSVLKLKKILFVKNAIVGATWGVIPLLTASYYGLTFRSEVLFLTLFFGISFFRSAMIFDIKDIKGDLEEGVTTIPNKYGIDNAKLISVGIDVLLISSWSALVSFGYLNFDFLILTFFHIYVLAYISVIHMDTGELFYSVIVDGECNFLGILVFISGVIGAI